MSAHAPGSYAGRLPAPTPGVYRVQVSVGDQVQVQPLLRSGDHEQQRALANLDPFADWQATGLIMRWPEHGVADALIAPLQPVPTQAALLLLALLTFALLLMWELLAAVGRKSR